MSSLDETIPYSMETEPEPPRSAETPPPAAAAMTPEERPPPPKRMKRRRRKKKGGGAGQPADPAEEATRLHRRQACPILSR